MLQKRITLRFTHHSSQVAPLHVWWRSQVQSSHVEEFSWRHLLEKKWKKNEEFSSLMVILYIITKAREREREKSSQKKEIKNKNKKTEKKKTQNRETPKKKKN
jgi:hypothetical protein